MNVYGTSEAYSSLGLAGTEQAPQNTESSDVNKQDFLLLLMAQLQHQDPMEPLSNEDFLAQLAQFNSMETMQQMGSDIQSLLKSNTMSRAGSLIGRVVTGFDKYSGEVVEGIAVKASINEDEVTMHVERYGQDGNYLSTHEVPVDSITEIIL